MGPGTLSELLKDIPVFRDENLLIGGGTMDDAGVYRIREDLALVQTLDFFPPMVDDPYTFGQIAAANSLSDVYAMGAVPLTAMNIAAFPVEAMDREILRAIFAGGADKLLEARAVLLGGHTVEDPEPKYGLSVTGVVHPEAVLANRGARPGDRLLLTKPLGSGIVCTAIKAGMADPATEAAAIETMCALNREAMEAARGLRVHACTDVTGFGLLGHACEMLPDAGVGFVLQHDRIPLLPGSRELAGMGLVPGGAHRNRCHVESRVRMEDTVPREVQDVLMDPQTSGGLLLSVAAEDAAVYRERMEEKGQPVWEIGEVAAQEQARVRIR